MKEAYDQFKSENPDNSISFSKFAKLKPSTVMAAQHNKVNTCRCEYCTSVDMKIAGVNNLLAKTGHRQLSLGNKNSTIDLTLCPKENGFHSPVCVERKCTSCGVGLFRQHLQPVLDDHKETLAVWDVWAKMDSQYPQNDGTLKTVTKWKPLQKSGPFDKLVTELQDEQKTFALH